MKTLLYLVIALISFMPVSAQEFGWVNISQNLPDTPYDTVYTSPDDIYIPLFRGMFFINDMEGWVGNTYAQDSHTIYHTTDGGESWEAQFVDYGIRAIYMFDSHTGYFGGDNGRLYKTTNGGYDWFFHGATGQTITHISFPPGSDTGYCSGVKGRISQITATGVNNMDFGTTGIDLLSICFPTSASEGWACGSYYIFHYIDGNWINTDQNCINVLSHSSIYFVPGTKYGWSVGDEGLLEHTIDGNNWLVQANPDTLGDRKHSLYSVFFRDTLTGWAVGSEGTILHTTDGGINWEIQESGTTNGLTKVFATPTNVYACGENHTVLKYAKTTYVAEKEPVPEFDIYPNPTVDIIYISGKFNLNTQYEISDLNGCIALKGNIPESQSIDISGLQAGAYFIKIMSGNEVYTERFIVEK